MLNKLVGHRKQLQLRSKPQSPINYYVDSVDGSDGEDGLTPDSAWQTLNKLVITSFSAGDVIALKRGSVFREILYPDDGGTSGNPISYIAYGAGAKPKITGCDLLTTWTQHSGSVYSVSYAEPIDTYVLLENGDHLLRVASLGAVNGPGRYFPDGAANTIYAWVSDGADPDTHVMEVGARYYACDCRDRQNVLFEGLHFHGGGGQFGASFQVSPTFLTPENVTILYCELSHAWYCGLWASYSASFLAVDNLRVLSCEVHNNRTFGLRIDAEDASHRITNLNIDNCKVYANGLVSEAGQGVLINHCTSPVIQHCIIYNNTGSLLWSDNLLFGDSTDVHVHHNEIFSGTYSGIHLDVDAYGIIENNLSYENNYNGIWVEEHELGSGHVTTIRRNTCWHNRHSLVFGPGGTVHNVSGVTVEKNIFAFNRRAAVELNDEPGYDFETDNSLDENCYSWDTADPLYQAEFLKDTPRANHTFAEWKTETGWDANSLAEDPLLVDPENGDFSLQPDSPCPDWGY